MSEGRTYPGVDYPVPFNLDGTVRWPAPDPSSPYFISGPANLSFSGGRTSAFMLFQILWAHGGIMPSYVFVLFANTGKERAKTLRFVHDVEAHWGCKVHWLEWQTRPKGKEGRATPPSRRYAEVGFNSASRNGEPFAALIERKGYLPNAVTRFCTTELKIETMKWFMLTQGLKTWTNIVGLRADEPWRVMKQMARNAQGKEAWRSTMPMSTAGHTEADVLFFWLGERTTGRVADWETLLAQPDADLPMGFDLGLRSYEGNCDLCFLKGEAKLIRLVKAEPSDADWWLGEESKSRASKKKGARFHKDRSFAQIVKIAKTTPMLPMGMEDEDNDEFDAECGLWCAGEVITKEEIEAQAVALAEMNKDPAVIAALESIGRSAA